MPDALLITPEAPFPPAGGGALRTAALAEYLARGYGLDVIVFRQPGQPDPKLSRLGKIARRVSVMDLPRHGRHGSARIVRNLGRLFRGVPPLLDRFAGFDDAIAAAIAGRRYELAVVEHFWCAPYAPSLKRAAGRLVLDLHNIESALHRGCCESEPWPLAALHYRFEKACKRLERHWLPEFSLVLVASEEDADRVRRIAPAAQCGIYPNTIPLGTAPTVTRHEAVVFSGNLEYHPNVNAILFFRDRIWPRLRQRHPHLVWRLVGKNPEAVRSHLPDDARIQLTGPVEDAVGEIAAARVAVAPLRAGSGTRLKILEAWAAATPVVSTTIGAEGLPAVPGEHLLIADDADEFARAVSRLLDSPRLQARLGAAGRALVEREFSWKAGWEKLADLGI